MWKWFSKRIWKASFFVRETVDGQNPLSIFALKQYYCIISSVTAPLIKIMTLPQRN